MRKLKEKLDRLDLKLKVFKIELKEKQIPDRIGGFFFGPFVNSLRQIDNSTLRAIEAATTHFFSFGIYACIIFLFAIDQETSFLEEIFSDGKGTAYAIVFVLTVIMSIYTLKFLALRALRENSRETYVDNLLQGSFCENVLLRPYDYDGELAAKIGWREAAETASSWYTSEFLAGVGWEDALFLAADTNGGLVKYGNHSNEFLGGAPRLDATIASQDWKDAVVEHLEKSARIFVIPIGRHGSALHFELEELVRRDLLHKTTFIMPPSHEVEVIQSGQIEKKDGRKAWLNAKRYVEEKFSIHLPPHKKRGGYIVPSNQKEVATWICGYHWQTRKGSRLVFEDRSFNSKNLLSSHKLAADTTFSFIPFVFSVFLCLLMLELFAALILGMFGLYDVDGVFGTPGEIGVTPSAFPIILTAVGFSYACLRKHFRKGFLLVLLAFAISALYHQIFTNASSFILNRPAGWERVGRFLLLLLSIYTCVFVGSIFTQIIRSHFPNEKCQFCSS